MTTNQQFDKVTDLCREVFTKKLSDYGAAWRIMRPKSVTDQIFIKANRIRNIEIKGVALVDEDVQSGLIGIINYAVIGLIQLELGFADAVDLPKERIMQLYNASLAKAKDLLAAKNHDYDEAWRSMRPESYTDMILMKIYRTKEIEMHDGKTLASEGIDANYLDMINYAVFGLIHLFEKENIEHRQ
ncbi:MAG: DUF1599 domain-containing protein [Prevotellaceae bacterium]|jgi:uncharacterized protein YbdZ (MbtH family)|nr:DUF1599 domain-containing protein [Prevotellaceae bacterium]